MTGLRRLHADARAIFDGALRACSIDAAMDRRLRLEGNTLALPSRRIPLDHCEEFLVIAVGKAAVSMTTALLRRLPSGIPVRGVCSGTDIPVNGDHRLRYFAGGHPLPNAASFAAAREALRLLREAGDRTFVFFLVSGGGSAMLELPRDPVISLEETLEFHRALVGSGATITEINTVRKRFSAIKGGGLALAAPHSPQLSLIVADVPLKDVEAVASSPTLPDTTTGVECWEVLDRFGLMDKLPRRAREWFERLREQPVQPREQFSADYEVLLSNDDLTSAAAEHARTLGYQPFIDNTCDDWNYNEACEYLLRRFRELRREDPRACLVSGGEVTVRLESPIGVGGRNQHFALAAAIDMARSPDERMAVLSVGSDGVDGNSNAAGAIADSSTVARARAAGVDPEADLAHFDSGTLFAALENAIVTGPTGTNLRDLRLLLGSS